MKMKHARPLLSTEESEKMLGLNASDREVSERNENKKLKPSGENKKYENQCPYDSCEWANKINGVCCMPHCKKKIVRVKK